MVSWKTDLKPSEMAQAASYVLSLVGTNPEEPKKAEGEIWIDPDMQTKTDAPMNEEGIETLEKTTSETLTTEVVNDSI
jgi:cytochrome c oxidase cbb3-type subunit 3